MRILHTESSINWGGQEYRALEQMEWLRDHGHEPFLAARPGSDIAIRAREAGLTVFDVAYTGHYDPRAILAVRRLVKQHNIEIADCHGSRDVMTLAFARGLMPVVRTRHVSQSLKNKLHRRLQWRYGSDHVIATAECIQEEILGKGLAPAEKISVVGEWAGESFFDVSRKDEYRREVRREFDVPEGSPLVCVVGMLRGDKAQEVLIETIAELKKRDRDVVALIVGSVTNSQDTYDQKLISLAKDLGVSDQVRFTGYREDIPRLTQACDAQVITSISVEAQSRTVPQAFASQTPVVASRVGGVSELVSDGETGRLVGIKDVSAYADALIDIFDNEAATSHMVETALAFAEQNLRMDAKMEDTIAIYEDLISRRR